MRVLPLLVAVPVLAAGCSSAAPSPAAVGASPAAAGATSPAAGSAGAALGTVQTDSEHAPTIATFTVTAVNTETVTSAQVEAMAEEVKTGDRLVTITAKMCLTAANQPVGATWAPWRLVLADGSAISPMTLPDASWFSAPIYPDDNADIPAGSCRQGLIAFDVPAQETSKATEVEYSENSGALLWAASQD